MQENVAYLFFLKEPIDTVVEFASFALNEIESYFRDSAFADQIIKERLLPLASRHHLQLSQPVLNRIKVIRGQTIQPNLDWPALLGR